MMAFFKAITIVSGALAALCVLVIPMWALGVPGVENQYAKGWKMGFNVILVYPLAWLLNYAPYFVMRNRMDAESRAQWQTATGSIACILLLAATVRIIQAFRIMR